MNTTLKRILCVILALILFLVLFLCIKNSKPANTSKEPDVAVEDTTEDNAADQNNDIYYEEENEGVELEIKKSLQMTSSVPGVLHPHRPCINMAV